MYRKLTVGEKKTIMYSLIFALVSIVLILSTLPEVEKDCLIETVSQQVATITIRSECLESFVKSMLFTSQIAHIVKFSFVAIFIYLVLFFIVAFSDWVKRPPNS
jgi:hypothetical protein